MKTLSKAFTLVELLVVLAIIAVLISILMPALNRARQQAHQVVCMAHLKQIGYAVLMYAMDNDDRFPDREITGGFGFRAAPGYKNPDDLRSLPEKYGMAAVLAKRDYIDAQSDIWVCNAQPHEWMRDLGNTYAFSTARMLSSTKTTNLKRCAKTWLIWDNYILKPFTPGVRAISGSTAGFTIDMEDRLFPHSYGGRGKKGTNVLYADGHSAPQIEQD